MALTRESVLDALKTIKDPVSGQDIVSAGVTRGLNVEGNAVRFVLEIDPAKAKRYRETSEIGSHEECTMCGDYCAIKQIRQSME